MLNIRQLRQTSGLTASISTDIWKARVYNITGTRQPTADTSRYPDGNRPPKQQFSLEKIIKKNTDIARFLRTA